MNILPTPLPYNSSAHTLTSSLNHYRQKNSESPPERKKRSINVIDVSDDEFISCSSEKENELDGENELEREGDSCIGSIWGKGYFI